MDEGFINSYRKPQLTGNWFLDLNPLNKLNIIIILVFIPIFYSYWQASVGITILYIILSMIAGSFKKFIGPFLKLGLIIGPFFFILRALFWPGETTLFKFGIINITQEGVNLGIRYGTIMLVVCGLLVLCSVTIKVKDLTYALERIGVPHTVSYIILSSFQSIIDLKDKSKVIMDSQKSRGIETEGNMLTRVRAFIPVLSPLFLGAISGAEEKSIAMDARAFSASGTNSHLRFLRPVPVWEKVTVVMVDLIVIAFVVWRFIA
ncbi:energy-coupling factor transporter transmembrane component T [Virgibacillus necropolis]|uniref:Cobalt transporter n=1 Tax=Virgibacillus necropolis TaxID=163877 RepID=A0A221M9C8_9BACI|nr:energy-coupling factor transporter transmembrane component T [Virgibacillus necropolis]ASN04256.1 cobalt transporter [Virgibacillus necropolis]